MAHLLRLGVLPTGYIYTREESAVHDLLRKRSTQILSIENLTACNLGVHSGGNEIKR